MGDNISKEILLEIIKRLLETEDLDFLMKLEKGDLESLVVAIRQRVDGNRWCVQNQGELGHHKNEKEETSLLLLEALLSDQANHIPWSGDRNCSFSCGLPLKLGYMLLHENQSYRYTLMQLVMLNLCELTEPTICR